MPSRHLVIVATLTSLASCSPSHEGGSAHAFRKRATCARDILCFDSMFSCEGAQSAQLPSAVSSTRIIVALLDAEKNRVATLSGHCAPARSQLLPLRHSSFARDRCGVRLPPFCIRAICVDRSCLGRSRLDRYRRHATTYNMQRAQQQETYNRATM